LAFAIVDEVDSILIDEARTPLIISGPAEESTELYQRVNVIVPKLRRAAKAEEADGDAVDGDFWVDEKQRQAHLTEAGHETVEGLFLAEGLLREGESLYDAANIRLMHHLGAALRANALYRRDVEYIVRDSEVIIVDEFTGRTMPGRRWSDGLHQAVEAKEGVRIREENQTVASITFQNYFRMYGKLAGMTGTADTEAFEFQQIYGLEVVVIPTHRPAVRKDHSDLVYLSQQDKFAAIVEDIRDCLERKQPVLVGTASIEASEELAALLRKEGIAHEVLNAKQHEREALIVALAGRPGAVTIATNMAGRGTDIVLGGNFEVEKTQAVELDEASVAKLRADWQQRHDQVLAAGGLHIVGTERHESRRIDNQLRGRSGRQGDPGSSRFYLSLEDNLMRIFGDPERMKALLSRVGMRPGEAIESALLTRQIERAQRKVEAYNFDLRKNLLEYDDVANDQRKVVYAQRFELQQSAEIADVIADLRREVVTNTITAHIPAESIEAQWDLTGAANALRNDFGVDMDVKAFMAEDAARKGIDLIDHVVGLLIVDYAAKEQQVGVETLRHIEKSVMMQMLDTHWREHLGAMDYMRQGISLRSYAQKNPKQEYKREAFELFTAMLDRIRLDTVTLLQRLQVRSEEEVEREERERAARLSSQLQFQHAEPPPVSGNPEDAAALASAPLQPAARPAPASAQRELPKIGRNEPCPCGSGRKFKHCHGMI
jgi:preprotein translocase subunit SecA